MPRAGGRDAGVPRRSVRGTLALPTGCRSEKPAGDGGSDPDVLPGAPEVCNSIDDDCAPACL